MNIIQFLNFFLMFLALGALTVSGWFFSTRGWTDTLPNGTVVKEGKIFKAWYFFWTQPMRDKNGAILKQKIYYEGEELKKLISQLQSNYPKYNFTVSDHGFYIHPSIVSDFIKFIPELSLKFDIQIVLRSENVFMVYKYQQTYHYAEWVRMPLAQCATCFASVYGSLFYWIGLQFIDERLFAWSGHWILAKIFFWSVFCFSLAVLNTALAKKFN